MHSRRQFLALSTATAVGASLQLPLGIAREKAAQDPFGGWPIGVQSYSLRNFNLHQAYATYRDSVCTMSSFTAST